jgi:hypothetical protein
MLRSTAMRLPSASKYARTLLLRFHTQDAARGREVAAG